MFKRKNVPAGATTIPSPSPPPPPPPPVESSSTKPSKAKEDESQRYANGTIVNGIYRLDKTIGKGSYGKVKLATNLQSGERVALKFIAKSTIRKPTHWTRIRREINLLTLLHHPHIVKLWDHFENETDIIIIMEWIGGSDLFERIVHRRDQRYSEKDARPIFRQIVSALDYCHGNRIIHRDLKPENLMVDDKNCVKLIDFGFANLFHPRGHLETNCGSPLYASPEIVQGVRYTGPEVDIWSLGVILFAMLTGTLPFEDEHLKGLYAKICAGSCTLPSYLSPGAKDLIKSMLTVDPRSRATLHHIRFHPWVCEGISFPPENFLPLRTHHHHNRFHVPAGSAHTSPSLQQDIIDEMMAKFGFVDAMATRHMILTQTESPAFAIYCLIEEKRKRDQQKRDAFLMSPPTTPVKKVYMAAPTTYHHQPSAAIDLSQWVNVRPAPNNVAIDVDEPPSQCQEPLLDSAKNGGYGIVAQAAAHVASRIKKLKEIKFGGGHSAIPTSSITISGSKPSRGAPASFQSPLRDVEQGLVFDDY